MLHHNIQTKIVEHLAANPGSTYAQIRPDGIESNAFAYHLKLLIKEGLVKKQESGLYRLTAIGGMISHKPNKGIAERVTRAYSVISLMVKDEDGRWLTRRRMYPPLHDYLESVISHPSHDELVEGTARRSFKESTGLDAEFKVVGNVLVRVGADDELLSYKNTLVLYAESFVGELTREAIKQKCAWMSTEDIEKDQKAAPYMKDIIECVDKGELFWKELRYEIPPEDV